METQRTRARRCKPTKNIRDDEEEEDQDGHNAQANRGMGIAGSTKAQFRACSIQRRKTAATSVRWIAHTFQVFGCPTWQGAHLAARIIANLQKAKMIQGCMAIIINAEQPGS